VNRLTLEYIEFVVGILAQVVAIGTYLVTSSGKRPEPWYRSPLGVWFVLLGVVVLAWYTRGLLTKTHNTSTATIVFFAAVDVLFIFEAVTFTWILPRYVRARRAERSVRDTSG
jgi:hypothetical protein